MLKRLKLKNLKKEVLPSTYNIAIEDIGHTYQITNGYEFFMLSVREGMEGHKLGEFMVTKKLGSVIHIKKKGKRKK